MVDAHGHDKAKVHIRSLTRFIGRTDADVFGPAGKEPYKTFKALWEDHPSIDYKLGGLLLALAYRMDEARQ